MKRGNWVGMDKRLAFLLPKDREYTYIEAMLCYSIDKDNATEGSMSGYAALWGWNRDKVRRFIKTIESGEDYLASQNHPTGTHTIRRQAIRYIFNNV